ncbi:MAG: HD domain-containing protein [Oscillospiraceae bacterium]|nr:HD domain-containing protein [Oscillospiraceae bacterium]
MEPQDLLNALHVAERLKDATRHCYTSGGRHESVAEHSWRLALMAYWLRDDFPGLDMDRVIRMCLIHDLGEAFTGDIPSFNKTQADEAREETLLFRWVDSLPEPFRGEMRALYREMAARESPEAKLFKALDNLEAVIQHNESDLSTWSENEFSLNLVYGYDKAAWSPVLLALRDAVREETEARIEEYRKEQATC